jgi:hypothetical protein
LNSLYYVVMAKNIRTTRQCRRKSSPVKKKKHKRGRPRYVVSNADLQTVVELAKKGCNEVEIARALKISQKTFQRNKVHFLPHIKRGREEGEQKNIEDVENALLKRAKGFAYQEKHSEIRRFPNGKQITVVREITKIVVPDTSAAIFYLCNRAKGRWQNKHMIQGDPEKPIPIIIQKGVDLSGYPATSQEAEDQ